MNCISEVRAFVINNFLFGDGSTLLDDDSFLATGIVDSTGMLELIMFLESNFNIKVEQEEMVPENLDSVNRLAGFIGKKLLTAGGKGSSEKRLAEEPGCQPEAMANAAAEAEQPLNQTCEN